MRTLHLPGGVEFTEKELRDLTFAWIAIGVAFGVFFMGGGRGLQAVALREGGMAVLRTVAISLVTAGFAFLAHELAHKVVAVHYGQLAQFRADYGMLFVALMTALIGFLFAAPGAVYHRGETTERQRAFIALAGPATNVALVAVFAPLIAVGAATDASLTGRIGGLGVAINLFLAAFNLVPVAGLDGQTVLGWSRLAWVAVFVPTTAVTVYVVFVVQVVQF